MGKWVVRPTGSWAQGPAAPCVLGRDTEAANLSGLQVGKFQPPEPAQQWDVQSENPPPWISARGGQTRGSLGETPHTCPLHRPVFLFCLPHPMLPFPLLQPSWLCPARVWVPCRASPPTFSPLSELCKQQRLFLGERHRCSDHRPNPATHPGPQQAARAENTQHLSL